MCSARKRLARRACLLTLLAIALAAGRELPLGYAGDIPAGVCEEGDCVNGKGTYRYADGIVYKGQFREGRRHGEGVFTLPNGDTYSGQFADDVYNGFGVFRFTDGSRYEGQFVNGVYHGYGVYFFTDGTKKEGLWRNGAFFRPLGEASENAAGKEPGKSDTGKPAGNPEGKKK